MFKLQLATKEQWEYSSEFYLTEKDKTQAIYDLDGNFVGLTIFNMTWSALEMLVLEFLYQGMGYGTQFVNFLFETYPIDCIYGESLQDAVGFWNKLGALGDDNNPLDEEEYTQRFTVTRGNFYERVGCKNEGTNFVRW